MIETPAPTESPAEAVSRPGSDPGSGPVSAAHPGPASDVDLVALLSTVALVNRRVGRLAGEDRLGRSLAAVRALSLLSELGPMRVTALAHADHLAQPTMTAQVNRLAAEGLIARKADPTDARATLVELTDAGRAELARVRQARARVVEPVLAGMAADDRRRLDEATAVLIELLRRLDVPGAVRR